MKDVFSHPMIAIGSYCLPAMQQKSHVSKLKLSNICYFEYPSSLKKEENFDWSKFFSPSIFKQPTVGIGTKDIAFSGCTGKHILRRKLGCACEEGGCCRGNNGHVYPSP